MHPDRERDEFRRIDIQAKVDRAKAIVDDYRRNISYYRGRIDSYHHLLGRISQRLGEPEPEEFE